MEFIYLKAQELFLIQKPKQPKRNFIFPSLKPLGLFFYDVNPPLVLGQQISPLKLL
ncbi:hypothetical protein MNB_SV-13-281 [hydrothermal vent metagenome]|uniref:Uncharacterized protein n=1 Tax=hydrothermal vent metagenome TaxID=652676 RepID=A0A1W1D1S7_9ZZZZ